MKAEIIKPKKEKKESKNLLNPIIYLVLGLLLMFRSNQVVELLFYVLGIIVIIYGIKSFVLYYQNKEIVQYKNINLTIAVVSIIIGVLLIVLSGVLETSIRYVLGFFFIFMGVSRLLTSISFNNYKNFSTVSNIILIALGIYSIFFSNAVLVIIGVILVINAIILFIDYFK
ncbi:MAG TPA: DUF308 domain-containing protein [Candidatus Caccenecus avistercoris]|nr:DUF308 domain-containing protein [Candidatus Caccenecus avistercoris]